MTMAASPTARRQGVSPAVAIANAVNLLRSNPVAAEHQARELLKFLPHDARAFLVIGAARRRLGDLEAAKRILSDVARVKHQSADAHFELGLTLGQAGDRDGAIRALRRALDLETDFAEAWLALSAQLYQTGDANGASEAYDEHIRVAVKDPTLREAIAALRESRLVEARTKLRAYLRAYPADLGAARMLGETLARLSQLQEAAVILTHCLKLAPEFAAARRQYAHVLMEMNRPDDAIVEFERLLAKHPDDPELLSPLAGCHVLRLDFDKAMPLLDRLAAENPNSAKIWINYGQSLRIYGDRDGAIKALRRAIAIDPREGEAYWSLADLKIGTLDDNDVAAMTKQVADPELPDGEQVAFHYSLGKAHEERRDWEASFRHYAEGARARRRMLPDDASENTAAIARLKRQFTREFLEEREGWGFADARPIFVVGLPRAGSTLIEQILGSHSDVEATMELSHIIRAANSLTNGAAEERRYPLAAAGVDREGFARLGQEYIAACAPYRKRDTPRFVDKMPTNFYHIGLIKLMLPNARIIDIRRDPMGGCFAAFKQYFFSAQNFSYDLTTLGQYYRGYLDVMTHYEHAAPGFIHRVHYDELVDDAEGEVRRLLDFLGLEFQESCLHFWRNDRPVATHSSEQVRRPIYRDALELWRHYEPWLDPLRESLGDALQTWKLRPVLRS
jgi:tetratricopeptide (TPR) repeat protein